MVSSIWRKRGQFVTPSIKDLLYRTRRSLIDSLTVLAVGLSVGLYFGLSASAREWAAEALGYGWLPLGLLTAVTIATLRYNHRAFFKHWRLWVVSAMSVAISIGILSTIFPANGTLEDVSLGGNWGGYLGGTPVIWASLKMAGIALIVSLIVKPRSAAFHYYRCARAVLVVIQIAWTFFYISVRKLARSIYERTLIIKTGIDRNASRKDLVMMLVKGQTKTSTRILAYQGDLEVIPCSSGISDAEFGFDRNGPDSLDFHRDDDIGQVPVLDSIPAWDETESSPRSSLTPAKDIVEGSTKGKRGKLGWQTPAVDLLTPPDTHQAPEAALHDMARLVESTLGDHGVRVEVTDVKAGPRIVRFGLVPGWVPRRGESGKANVDLSSTDRDRSGLERSRVKVQSILTREKDMALALKTPYLRIEAPVPGEALVGLEVPSPSPSKVHLREVMETQAFSRLIAKGGLPIALGQDTGGSPVVLDLASLPHMLIAGATGSGKSVCINSIVASFLLTKTPEQLRILMVDPKRVELTPFNGIPHLVGPVIVDAEEVNTALRGLIREMLARYKLMEEVGARNIEGYNKRAKERMPFLVLIVDELADLMMVGGFEVEQNLVRLAQLGRATGIHLVLATQRPSVNVVTGLLKANIPARAAFAVASQVDSRVILDAVGAEKLLGKGDMLLLHNESPKPSRVQGTLVYDQEIDHMVEFWLSQTGPPLPVINVGEIETDDDDESVDARILEEARELAARNPQLTSSYLERRLKIGGRKAEEIIELLKDEGFLDLL